MADARKINALIRHAKRENAANPKAVLDALHSALMKDEVVNGKVLISASEAGGSATFALFPGYSPLDFLALVEEAIQELDAMPDPMNPTLTKRNIRRLRVSFAKAQV